MIYTILNCGNLDANYLNVFKILFFIKFITYNYLLFLIILYYRYVYNRYIPSYHSYYKEVYQYIRKDIRATWL